MYWQKVQAVANVSPPLEFNKTILKKFRNLAKSSHQIIEHNNTRRPLPSFTWAAFLNISVNGSSCFVALAHLCAHVPHVSRNMPNTPAGQAQPMSSTISYIHDTTQNASTSYQPGAEMCMYF